MSTHRKPKFSSSFCHAVLAIPDSGLFVKDGQIRTGHSDTPMSIGDMPLFTRIKDAQNHAQGRANAHAEEWPDDPHRWDFVVISVLVSER